MGDQTWYYSRNGEQSEPVSFETLRLMAAGGQLMTTDLVWTEGMQTWAPASSIPELAEPGGLVPPPLVAGVTSDTPLGYYNDAFAGAVGRSRDAYGGFWLRVGAYLIDAIILFIPQQIIDFGVQQLLAGGRTVPLGRGGSIQSIQLAVFGVTFAIGTVMDWLYFALQEAGPSQATIGKRACGLKVTDLTDARITFARATGRYFGKILSGMACYLGFIAVAWSDRRQGWHDQMAGTYVVRTN